MIRQRTKLEGRKEPGLPARNGFPPVIGRRLTCCFGSEEAQFVVELSRAALPPGDSALEINLPLRVWSRAAGAGASVWLPARRPVCAGMRGTAPD
jgi:hypothetical protein